MARKLRVVIDDQEFVVNGWMEVYQYDEDETKPEQLVARYTTEGNRWEGSGTLQQPLTGERRAKLVPASASANFGAQPGTPATLSSPSLGGVLAGQAPQGTFAGSQTAPSGPGGMGVAGQTAGQNITGQTGANPPPPHGATGQPQGVQTSPQPTTQTAPNTGSVNPTGHPQNPPNTPGERPR